jgi:membrane protein DedA with SNARE-associated domain
VKGYWEQGDEHSGTKLCGKFLDKLRNYFSFFIAPPLLILPSYLLHDVGSDPSSDCSKSFHFAMDVLAIGLASSKLVWQGERKKKKCSKCTGNDERKAEDK